MKIDVDRERAVTAALRRLAQAPPPPNPRREATILAAFDAAWSGAAVGGATRRRTTIRHSLGIAAMMAAAIVISSVMVRLKPDTTQVDDRRHRHSGSVRLQPDPTRTGSVRLQPDLTSAGGVLQPDAAGADHVRLQPHRSKRSSAGGAPTRLPAPIQRDDPSAFIPWPGSIALPPLESGAFVRIDLPVSVLPSLGVLPPPHAGAVQADVLVGQDGFARAVRLVPFDQLRE